MRIDRNQPCPCGSGKKVRQCCGAVGQVPLPLLRQRLPELLDTLHEKLLDCFDRHFGEAGQDLALAEFFLWPEEKPDEEKLADFESLLFPWIFYMWLFDPEEAAEEGIDLEAPAGVSTAELLDSESDDAQLSALERALLHATLESPMSFWEVGKGGAGRELELQDLFTLEKATVERSEIAEDCPAGAIFFGQIVGLDGFWFVNAAAPVLLPPDCRPELMRLRARLVENGSGVDPEILVAAEFDLRELYFDLMMRSPVAAHPRGQDEATTGEAEAGEVLSWEWGRPRDM